MGAVALRPSFLATRQRRLEILGPFRGEWRAADNGRFVKFRGHAVSRNVRCKYNQDRFAVGWPKDDMRRKVLIFLGLVLNARAATTGNLIIRAASHYIPNVVWQAKSSVTGDFTCEGHRQTAILGTAGTDVVVAVFLNGLSRKPEELRFDIFETKFSQLRTESLDYELDYDLPGFRRSKACLGLNVGDMDHDSAHLYWDHNIKKFGIWRL